MRLADDVAGDVASRADTPFPTIRDDDDTRRCFRAWSVVSPREFARRLSIAVAISVFRERCVAAAAAGSGGGRLSRRRSISSVPRNARRDRRRIARNGCELISRDRRSSTYGERVRPARVVQGGPRAAALDEVRANGASLAPATLAGASSRRSPQGSARSARPSSSRPAFSASRPPSG